MKNSFYILLMVVTLTTFLKAQEKGHYSIYMNYGTNIFQAKDSQYKMRSFPFLDANKYEVGDTIKIYGSQYTYKHRFNDKGFVSAGVVRVEPLSSKLNVKYFAGLNYTRFSYDALPDTSKYLSNIFVLTYKAENPDYNRYDIIFFDSPPFNEESDIQTIQSANLLNLELGIGAAYRLTSKLDLGIGFSSRIPLTATIKGYSTSNVATIDSLGNLIFQKIPGEQNRTTPFTNFLTSVYFSTSWAVTPSLSVSGTFSSSINSFAGTKNSSLFNYTEKITISTLQAGIIYRL